MSALGKYWKTLTVPARLNELNTVGDLGFTALQHIRQNSTNSQHPQYG